METLTQKVLLLLYLFELCTGEGTFEDSDKAIDFLSHTHQQFDLRHTIPGEPHIDYPIYSSVPTTSFSCANKHEGYYADVESRCQVFRICTNTARHSGGFGFLCPNGTLFSQRHFVCDWYRNVRCEESENFYNKNTLNHVGNSVEMMETVRQMIEYPMKTISKALAPKPVNKFVHTPTFHNVKPQQQQQQQPQQPHFSQTSTVRESLVPEKHTSFISSTPIRHNTQNVLRGEDIKSLPKSRGTQDVYVNSLGELSTDPGIKFDANTARIIAKLNKSGRVLNFAQSINFGLNEYKENANSLHKTARSNKDEGILGANVSTLKHKIQAELSSKTSRHQNSVIQKSKQSHGFSNAKKELNKSYRYQSPKQSASIPKFTSNDTTHDIQIPQNTEIPEDIHFTFMPTKQLIPPKVDTLSINALYEFDGSPIVEQTESTLMEENLLHDATEMKFYESISTSTPITTIITTTSATDPPTTISFATEPTKLEPYTKAVDVSSNLVVDPISESREFADKLLFSGVQITQNQIDNDEGIITTTPMTTTITTTTPKTENFSMQTSTEMVTEVNMIETRLRGHRHFNIPRNRTTTPKTPLSTTTTTTKRPIANRGQLRRNLTATREEPTTATPKRKHHSKRQRHRNKVARLDIATTTPITTTTPARVELNLQGEISEINVKRKLNVRNIDKSTAARGNSLFGSRYANVNNQRRRTTTTTTKPIASTSKVPETQTIARRRQNTIRARGSHTYQQQRRRTTATTRTTLAPTTLATNVEHIEGTILNIIPLNVSVINAIDSAPTFPPTSPTIFNNISNTQTQTQNHILLHTNNNNNNNNINETDNLIPFDELTRAIVDESILQNYRLNQPPTISKVKPQQSYTTKSTVSQKIFPQTPNIVIARAEGQRLDGSNTPMLDYSQINANRPYQQQQNAQISHATPYVPLNDFLSNKFGQQQKPPTTNYYQSSYQQPQPQLQQQQNRYFQTKQITPNYQFSLQSQQQHQQQQQQTKHIVYAQPAQTQYQQHNIYKNAQKQLPFYSNQQPVAATQTTFTYPFNALRPQVQQQTSNFLNIKLPTANDAVIPAAYSQVAQRRSDNFNFELETSTSPRMKLFTGVSSYDVPLSSVGRLPNDITQKVKKYKK